jgi:hypothetical protein
MTSSEEAASGTAKKRARGRAELAIVLAVLVVLLVGAAYFQEEIGYFFQLRAWDPGAPGRTVTRFLQAGREGNRSEADRCVDVNLFHPLEQRGKWVGYQIGTPMGSLEYVFTELAGRGEIRPTHSELVFKGNGAAMVTMPDAGGHPIEYRLAMQGGAWKITEIRGGRVRR